MRQVADLMVWFGVILVLAAVIYITPRLADYVTTSEPETGRAGRVLRQIAHQRAESTSVMP